MDTKPTASPTPTGRWTPKRKAEVCRAVIDGEIDAAQACARYALTSDELKAWLDAYARAALAGGKGCMKLKAMVADRSRPQATDFRAEWRYTEDGFLRRLDRAEQTT